MKKFLWVLLAVLVFTFNAFAAVNINTATQAELETIKGIGPAKAQAIIDYRTKNGPFKSVDDLDNVNGFGKKSIDKMRSDIMVSGASVAAPAKAKPGTDAAPAGAKPAKDDSKKEAKDSKKK